MIWKSLLAFALVLLATPCFSQEKYDPAIVAAVKLLPELEVELPRIKVVNPKDLKIPKESIEEALGMDAFRLSTSNEEWRPEPTIYINKNSLFYRGATLGWLVPLIELAAVITHEVAHDLSRDDEPAYRAEALALRRLSSDLAITTEDKIYLWGAAYRADRNADEERKKKEKEVKTKAPKP